MIAYGILGTAANIDPDKIYDYHTAFDIRPTDVVYNVDINASSKAIKKISNLIETVTIAQQQLQW